MQDFERRLPADAAQMNHPKHFFFIMKNNMAVAQNVYLDFYLTAAANKTLEFGMRNFAPT
jgi:hypothetical protein